MSKDQWGEGNIFLRGRTYWIQYSIHGHRRRESAKTEDPNKARKLLRRRLTGAESGEAKPTNILVGRLLDDLLAFYQTNRPKSAWWAELVIEKHLRKPFEFYRAATFGTDLIHGYVHDRKKIGGVGNSTINRELALLRRAFSLGAKHEPPLVTRVPWIQELEEPPARAGFFEAADFDRLCAELPDDVRDVAVFAYWTGCRKTEILTLPWSRVDFKERLVRLEQTKSGEPREIPLSGELLALIDRRLKQRDADWPWCQWAFCRDGQRIVNFYTSWKSACERAGLKGEARLLHDLRRTGVRNLIRAGVPEKVAMLISGHRTRAVFDRYHIVKPDDLRDAMKKLEKHLGRGKRK